MNLKAKLIILFTALLVLGGCVSKPQQQKQTARTNQAFLYNPSSSPLHPEFVIYHERPEFSRMYVKIYPVELLFSEANKEGIHQAKLRIRYTLKELIEGKESELIADSSSNEYNLKMDEAKEVFLASIPIKAIQGKMYLLEIHSTDLLRGKGSVNFVHIDKSSVNTAQNYKVISASTGYPSFDRVFNPDERFYVKYNRRGVDTVYIKYFKNRFPLPRPPVTNLPSDRPDFIADSIYAFPYSDTISYTLRREGMYHIQVDPNQPGGLSLFNFGENYPRITTPKEMIGPLAYLASTVEFNEISTQTNQKLSVDNFWLQCAGNIQTARELIRVYYNRVFFANYYFTSYKEGWKTDRGMMFIVYGPPNILTKQGNNELWVYYRKKSNEPIQFTFSRHQNHYSPNDFLLERNYVTSLWVQAVRDWRSGKIFYTDTK